MVSSSSSSLPLKQWLKQVGLRITPSRLAVLAYLAETQRTPVSHAELTEALAPLGFDRITLYRNLTDLTKTQLLLRVDYGDQLWRYSLHSGVLSTCTQANHHHHNEACFATETPATAHIHPHFVCSQCNQLICLPSTLSVESWQHQLPNTIASVDEVVVRGRCTACAKP
jgi:Fur family transcriptional regulator, ferric uptake regulator